MPKNKPTNGSDRAMPLIVFDEVTSEKESFKLSWTVLANLREYVAYVKDTTGKDTTPDEEVDKGMQRLFDADRGFHQWLQKKNADNKGRVKNAKAEKPGLDGKTTVSDEPLLKPQF
jgi:hypothetical protein